MGTSSQTMMKSKNSALTNRLAQLNAMPSGKSRNFKKNSFDIKDSKRSQSIRDRDRYFSIATTKTTELKKIEKERKQQREQVVKQQNLRRKKYIQSKSKKNIFDGVKDDDDEKKMPSDDNMEAAMLLEDEQLAKVNNDADAQLAETPLSPASAIK